MTGTNHYVPILRWKQAERLALHHLRDQDKGRITPVIEITPKSFAPPKGGRWKGVSPDPGRVLEHHAKEILRHWGYAPFFLEFAHIEGTVGPIKGSIHPLSYVAELGRSYKLNIVPVSGIDRPVGYQRAVAEVVRADAKGVCLRVTPSQVLEAGFSKRLKQTLRDLGGELTDADLLLDYGVFDPQSPTIRELLEDIPELSRWRSLVVARGAFPKDLQGYTPGTHIIPRSDWITWRQEISESGIPRRPSFSDYTIQYGRYEPPVENANPSASIRYALEEDWLILRGEGIFNEDGPGRAQWNANAMLLRDRSDFYGGPFSDGDSYIVEMSRNGSGHGSPMTWIRAGLNHHMTVVARQIAAL